MDILLLKNIKNLGEIGNKVSVKSGYARNYLIPKNYAVLPTKENLAIIEQQKQELEERVLKLIEEKAGQCTKTDVTRKRITENSKSAQSLLQSMVNRGLLVEETLAAPGRGGHQQTIYKPI